MAAIIAGAIVVAMVAGVLWLVFGGWK